MFIRIVFFIHVHLGPSLHLTLYSIVSLSMTVPIIIGHICAAYVIYAEVIYAPTNLVWGLVSILISIFFPCMTATINYRLNIIVTWN